MSVEMLQGMMMAHDSPVPSRPSYYWTSLLVNSASINLANSAVFSVPVVVDAINGPVLWPDAGCLWMRVCVGVHGVEPLLGRVDLESRIVRAIVVQILTYLS
jgi:hypothetical protein